MFDGVALLKAEGATLVIFTSNEKLAEPVEVVAVKLIVNIFFLYNYNYNGLRN